MMSRSTPCRAQAPRGAHRRHRGERAGRARRLLGPAAVALLAAWVAAGVACGPSAAQQEADRKAILALLDAYLPALAHTYVTGDSEGLHGLAAEKEVLAAEKLVLEQAKEGVVIEPTFKDLTVERLDVYQHSNAYVTTLEHWDLRKVVAGSGRLLGEYPDQTYRVRYQLKRTDDGWKVLYRQTTRLEP
jgi:hypothetical protein